MQTNNFSLHINGTTFLFLTEQRSSISQVSLQRELQLELAGIYIDVNNIYTQAHNQVCLKGGYIF